MSSALRNVVVAQSGGPSPVINNSLRGVIEACRDYPSVFGNVYGAWHGIEGVLKEELINLSTQPTSEISLLRTTPGAGAIGTCRYKMKSSWTEDFERAIDVLKAHNVGYFFYIGGNDSMDTAHKMAALAHSRGLNLVASGVPKTIDNDIGDSEFQLIDHTPGFGSVARYWMSIVQQADEENRGSSPSDPVLVLQAMGRKIGFIAASARLADPDHEMPLQIYLAESGLGLPELAEKVNAELSRSRRVIVVVNEGLNVGSIGESKDSFGHTQFSSSQMTVAQIVTNYLNDVGLSAPGSARCQVPGTDQRTSMAFASTVDLEEAYAVGQKAVQIAVEEGGGYMSTLHRQQGALYTVSYGKVLLDTVANSERKFPSGWLNKDRIDVTDDFIRYAKPLVGEDWVSVPLVDGRQRFARLSHNFAEKKLSQYIPVGYRPKES